MKSAIIIANIAERLQSDLQGVDCVLIRYLQRKVKKMMLLSRGELAAVSHATHKSVVCHAAAKLYRPTKSVNRIPGKSKPVRDDDVSAEALLLELNSKDPWSTAASSSGMDGGEEDDWGLDDIEGTEGRSDTLTAWTDFCCCKKCKSDDVCNNVRFTSCNVVV